MTSYDRKLHDGAERLWSGSGDDILIVRRGFDTIDAFVLTAGDFSDAWSDIEQRRHLLTRFWEALPTNARPGSSRYDRIEAAQDAIRRLRGRNVR